MRSVGSKKLLGLLVFATIAFLIQGIFMTNYLVFGFGTRGGSILSGIIEGELFAIEAGTSPSFSSATFVKDSIWNLQTCSARSMILFLPSVALATGAVLLRFPDDRKKQIVVGAAGVIGFLAVVSLFGDVGAVSRFVLILEGVGVCAIAFALAGQSDQVSKRRAVLILLFILLLGGTQIASAAASPDYENCERRYLTQAEVDGKEWGADLQDDVLTNYYFSDVKLHPVGNHIPGLNHHLANQSFENATDHKYVALRTDVELYSTPNDYRIMFTYDPEAELDKRSTKIYSNGEVVYYLNPQ